MCDTLGHEVLVGARRLGCDALMRLSRALRQWLVNQSSVIAHHGKKATDGLAICGLERGTDKRQNRE
jgi:hypothetical protein